MSAPIGPGDWVECVAGQRVPGVEARFRLGGIERVEAVGEYFGHPFVVIVGKPSGHVTRGYALQCFRPIYPGGKLIPLLLEKLPEDERVDA